MDSLKQLLFFLFFDVLLLLLFIFSGTFLKLYIIFIFVILFLFFIPFLEFNKIINHKKEVILWFLLLLSLVISSFFTHSFPLTLDSIVFYIFSFIFFIFFLIGNKDFFKRDFLFLNIFLVLFVLNLISYVYYLVPEMSNMVPSINILYSNYGHNHLGALLVMFIPINWFYIHQSWKEKKYNHFYLWLSSLSLLLISLLFSYGRVVITLGFIEILLLGSFSIKSFLKKKKWRVLYLLILTIFIGMVGSKIIIGALEKESRNQLCEIVYDTDNNFKTCKRFDLNSRIDYWKTSVIAIKKNPLFGYGPGTYSLINSRYKIKPESSTAYAHNAFLQIFAESGVIVFLVFSSLMILGLWKVIKISFKDLLINKKNIFGNLSLNKSIAIGLTAIYIDVLFDFDWSLLSIYLITLMLTAIVLGSKSKKTIKNIKKRQFIIFTKILYLFCSFTIISIVVINLIIESLIFSNNSNTAVKVFPYFHSHIKLLALNKNLSPDSKEKLMKVYQYDSSYYSFSNQNEMLLKYSNEIKKIDPWYYYSRGILINIDPKFEKEIERELMLTGQAFSDAKKYGSLGNIESNKELSVLASNIGDMYLRKNDLKNAAVFYKLSLDFHQWAWNEVKPLFVSHNFSISEQLTFWDEMNYVEPKSFATYQFPVAKSFQVLADYDFERKNWDDLLIKVEYMGEVAHWVKSDYLRLKEKDLQDEADLMIEKGDNYSAIKILEIMSKSTTEYWSIVQLANYYVLSNEDDKAMNAFQECNIVWKKYNNDEEHDACFYGMRSLEKGTIDRGNYYNVSNTIKNNLL